MATEAQRRSLALARAVRHCKSNGQCLYPYCKLMIGQCWTQEEINAVQQQLRSSRSSEEASE